MLNPVVGMVGQTSAPTRPMSRSGQRSDSSPRYCWAPGTRRLRREYFQSPEIPPKTSRVCTFWSQLKPCLWMVAWMSVRRPVAAGSIRYELKRTTRS